MKIKKLNKLHKKYLINFITVFLIPITVFMIFTNFYITNKIKNDSFERQNILLEQIAIKIDSAFIPIRNDMIILSSKNTTSDVNRELILKENHDVELSYNYINSMEDVKKTIVLIEQNYDLIDNCFVFFKDTNMVLDSGGVFSLSDYLDAKYQGSISQIYNYTEGKQSFVMFNTELTDTQNSLMLIQGYPYNSSADIFVIAAVDWEVMYHYLAIESHEEYIAEIVTDNIIINEMDLSNKDIDDYLINSRESEINNWMYRFYTPLSRLLKPVRTIQIITYSLFLLLMLFDFIISFIISKRMYKPIEEIVNKFIERYPNADLTITNELEKLNVYGSRVINQNLILNQRVQSMMNSYIEIALANILKERDYDLSVLQDILQLDGRQEYTDKYISTVCIKIYFDELRQSLTRIEKNAVLNNLKILISKKLEHRRLLLTETDDDNVTCIIHFNKYNDLTSTVDSLESIITEMNSINNATISVGEVVEDSSKMSGSYKIAKQNLKLRKFISGIQVIDTDEVIDMDEDSFLQKDEMQKLHNMLHASDISRLLSHIEEHISLLEKIGQQREWALLSIKDLILYLTPENFDESRNQNEGWSVSEMLMQIDKCIDKEDIMYVLETWLENFKLAEKHMDKKAILDEVIAEIKKDYSNTKLSIAYFSEKYTMSLGHFSRLFKEFTGLKYVDFINKERINVAKKMLLESDCNQAEIAQSVGFLSSKSFNTIFKKYEGITPGKYKSLYTENKK